MSKLDALRAVHLRDEQLEIKAIQDEARRKQAKNKFNVCKAKAGNFDSIFEQQVFDNLTRMQEYFDFDFGFHIPEESVHWFTNNRWNKRYEAIGLTKDDICNDKIHHLYEPDFIVVMRDGRKFYIESKGYFPSTDRTKMKTIKKLHPELDICMLFMTKQKLKGLKITNIQWCLDNDFKVSYNRTGMLPKEWFR